MGQVKRTLTAHASYKAASALNYTPVIVNEFPKARTAFLSTLIPRSSDVDPNTTLSLKDRNDAALTRGSVS